MSGLLISIEGIEGAGKTSLITGLSSFLEGKGKTIVTTREPGGTQLGAKIRELLLDDSVCSDSTGYSSEMAEVLLFAADRAEHCLLYTSPSPRDS